MYRSRLVRVWHNLHQKGRCKFCRRSIVFVTTDMGKCLPFNPGFSARSDVTEDDRGRKFVMLSFEDFHACPEKPKTPKATSQGRLL